MNRFSVASISCILICFVLFFAVQASGVEPGPEVEWVQEYPADEILILSVCESSSGGYYAGGNGPGGRILVKLDESGNYLWKKEIPGSDQNGSIVMIKESPAGGLVLFADGEDLIKTTFEGDVEWEYHQPSGKVSSIEVAPDGSSVMAGTYFQGFLKKVSPQGKESWSRTLGNPEGGGQYILRSVKNVPGGGFIAAGYINPVIMVTDYRGFLMRTDENGNKTWARQYSGESSGMLDSVACTPSGGFAATRLQVPVVDNESSEEPDLLPSVIFTDSEGEVTGFEYYNRSVSYVYHIANDKEKGYYLVGLDLTNPLGSGEYKILEIDLSGKMLWQEGLDDLELTGFITTTDGGILISGLDPSMESVTLVKYSGAETVQTSGKSPGFGAIVAVFSFLSAALIFISRRS